MIMDSKIEISIDPCPICGSTWITIEVDRIRKVEFDQMLFIRYVKDEQKSGMGLRDNVRVLCSKGHERRDMEKNYDETL